jgi:hypothetical protein
MQSSNYAGNVIRQCLSDHRNRYRRRHFIVCDSNGFDGHSGTPTFKHTEILETADVPFAGWCANAVHRQRIPPEDGEPRILNVKLEEQVKCALQAGAREQVQLWSVRTVVPRAVVLRIVVLRIVVLHIGTSNYRAERLHRNETNAEEALEML